MQSANVFFVPPRELRTLLQFGFVFSEYRGKSQTRVPRLPGGRATLYFAADVRTASSARPVTGLFCEGPRPRGWALEAESGLLVGFKVRAGALKALLGVPAREVRGQTIPLDAIWGSDASSIAERMSAATSLERRIEILAQHLIRRSRAARAPDRDPVGVAHIIDRRCGRVQVADLVDRTGYSQRALLKKFDEWVGLTPKQYARIARLRATIVRLATAHGDTARLALECGFCDQAHMIHEFQDLLGRAPVTFFEQRGDFSPVGAPSYGRHALPRCEQRLYHSVGHVSRWLESTRSREWLNWAPPAQNRSALEARP